MKSSMNPDNFEFTRGNLSDIMGLVPDIDFSDGKCSWVWNFDMCSLYLMWHDPKLRDSDPFWSDIEAPPDDDIWKTGWFSVHLNIDNENENDFDKARQGWIRREDQYNHIIAYCIKNNIPVYQSSLETPFLQHVAIPSPLEVAVRCRLDSRLRENKNCPTSGVSRPKSSLPGGG